LEVGVFQLPADAVEPEFTALYDYWRGKCRNGRLPARRDIDPLELPRSMLPNMLLLDVDRSGGAPRFRVRLAGTGFVALYGYEVTGRYFDELAPTAAVAPLMEQLHAIVATREPRYLASPLTAPNNYFCWIKRFALPLASDGETVDMVIAWFRAVATGDRVGVSAAE
jgi:hypothetical protein